MVSVFLISLLILALSIFKNLILKLKSIDISGRILSIFQKSFLIGSQQYIFVNGFIPEDIM